jgi:hypothetical protein
MNNLHKNYKLAFGITVILISMAALITGCGLQKASSETGVISDVTMSTDVDSNNRPVNPTNVFTTDADGFFVSFKMSGFPVGAKVEVQWIYVSGPPEVEAVTGKDYVAETQTAVVQAEGQGYTYTVYAKPPIPDYTWPEGNYKVVINVDGLEKGSAYFTVQ